MTTDRESGDARNAIEDVGFKFHRLLQWDKVTVSPNRWFMQPCEFAWYHYKGRARPITNPSSKAKVTWPHRDETKHPTEKPVGVMKFWIEQCCDVGAMVGTTLIGAARAGRCAIGIEQDQKWFDVAVERVTRDSLTSSTSDLFAGVGGDL